MQSTKKAPLRKEDGTTAAGDDAATITQTAGPNATQPVRPTKMLFYKMLYSVVKIVFRFRGSVPSLAVFT